MQIEHKDSFNARRAAAKYLRPAFIKNLLLFALIGALLVPAALPSVVSAQAVASKTETELLDPTGAGSPDIDGKAYVLYDVQSETFLVGENQDTPLSPASITKVMTVLLALENLELADTITVTSEMYKTIPNDYVRLGLVEGEIITVEQALYACLLISANDAAMALALKIGGTEAGFIALMNKKAAELGCTNTNFTNPYGYADKENLTTAHDMALILAAALKYDTYTTISTTKHYLMTATNKSAGKRGMTNGNRFVTTTKFAYEYYIGGKTGFTNLSGHTITAGARKDGRTLIGVILGASYSEIRYANLISLFDYGFSAFRTDLVDPSEYAEIKTQAVSRLKSDIETAGYDLSISNVDLNLEDYIAVPVAMAAGGYNCEIDMSQASVQDSMADQLLVFPLYRAYSDGTKYEVGALEITVASLPVIETTTVNTSEPKANWGKSILRVVLIIVFSLVFAFCLLVIYARIRSKVLRRRRRNKSRII